MSTTKDIYKALKIKIKDQKIKVLFFDIETSPMQVWTHYIGNKVSIQHNQIEKESKVITIQYMFEGDKTPKYLQWDWDGKNGGDDKSMLEEFSHILNSATIAITQNGNAFDLKVLRWRLNLLNLTAVNHITMLDTLTLSRQSFRAPSHRLDFRSRLYGLGGKDKMEFQDWVDIVKGDRKKLDKMIKYGLKDVTDLRSIFWKELPYYTKLPISLACLVKENRDHCPRCADRHQKKFNVYPTKIDNKDVMECGNCNHHWKKTRS
jgi:uncharacterized protein YprB with RNaseH-like and TPR domain